MCRHIEFMWSKLDLKILIFLRKKTKNFNFKLIHVIRFQHNQIERLCNRLLVTCFVNIWSTHMGRDKFNCINICLISSLSIEKKLNLVKFYSPGSGNFKSIFLENSFFLKLYMFLLTPSYIKY